MSLHQIELNARKTVHARRSSEDLLQPITLVGVPVGTVLSEGEPFRLLGVWLSTHCLRHAQLAQMQQTVKAMSRTVASKLCTDKMIKVVYRAVVIPKIAYMSTGQCLSLSDLESLEVPFRKVLKNKSGLPSSVATSLLHSSLGFAVPRLSDVIFAKDLCDFQVWLNSPSLVGQVTRVHFRQLQERFFYPAFPGQHPVVESPKERRDSKYVHLLGELAQHGVSISGGLGGFVRNKFLHSCDRYICEVVSPDVWRDVRRHLHQHGFFYLSQIRDCRAIQLRSQAEITGRRFQQDCRWYKSLAMELTGTPDNSALLHEHLRGMPTTDRPHTAPLNRPVALVMPPSESLLPSLAEPAPVEPLFWWTDGSLDTSGSQAGCAAVRDGATVSASLRGPPGSMSSTTAELGGILLALRSTPLNQAIVLRSDSQAALAVLSAPFAFSVRLRMKRPDSDLIAAIQFVLSRRVASHDFIWVRGHAGDPMNELADTAANCARVSGPLLSPRSFVTPLHHFRLCLQGHPLCVYGRTLVKHLAATAHDSVFLGSSQGRALAALSPAEREVTIAALRSAESSESALITSRHNCRFRAFRYKLAMRLLPTMVRQAMWRPDLYHEPRCLLCQETAETTDHLFSCPANLFDEATLPARLSEELHTLLPSQSDSIPLMVSALLGAGLRLSAFRGVLPAGCLTLLSELPLSCSPTKAGTGVLRALFRLAYELVWKPRSAEVQRQERLINVSRRQKFSPAVVSVPPSAAAVVAASTELPHSAARSPVFGKSLATDASLWARAGKALLALPPT